MKLSMKQSKNSFRDSKFYKDLLSQFNDLLPPVGLDSGSIGEVLVQGVLEQSIDFVFKNLAEDLKLTFVTRSFQDFKSYRSAKDDVLISRIDVGSKLELKATVEGLERQKRVWDQGQYSVLGDVVTIWPSSHENPIRISHFDNDIEAISIIDPQTRVKVEDLQSVVISNSKDGSKVIGTQGRVITVANIAGLTEYSDDIVNLGLTSIPKIGSSLENFLDTLVDQGYTRFHIDDDVGFISKSNKEIFTSNFEEFGEVNLLDGEDGVGVLDRRSDSAVIKIGDFVVHQDHGVGKFVDIQVIDGKKYFELEYLNNDKLYIPFEHMDFITKYVGTGKSVKLTPLNNRGWKAVKQKATASARHVASHLLQLYALRRMSSNPIYYSEANKSRVDKFIDSFKYTDTHDQAVVTEEVLGDYASQVPADRLLVGDVAFGKTEIAMRAAFAVASGGGQVVILVPTTVLAFQHYENIKKRFRAAAEEKNFKFGLLVRHNSKEESEKVKEGLASGVINIVIGTHSVLQSSVVYKDLGLVIVDEEQRFGVKQKEKLREKRAGCHTLSLSATPIPRSLNMALSGIREISIISTPPKGRKAVINKFAEFDWEKIKSAIKLEIDRGGQVFFLKNNTRLLDEIALKISNDFPKLNVETAHGQMKNLPQVMAKFVAGEIDVLVCTTIIENGIDIDNVNTLIVEDSNRFGLAQLYQIRGRIGRGTKQAYAHFFNKKGIKDLAKSRLAALASAQELGSGYFIASKDIEIRGVGDLLGVKQSGTIDNVGVGMFMKLVRDEVRKLRG